MWYVLQRNNRHAFIVCYIASSLALFIQRDAAFIFDDIFRLPIVSGLFNLKIKI